MTHSAPLDIDTLTEKQSSLIILKTLCVLGDSKYSQLACWPFEDITINDLFFQIKKMYSNITLREKFIKFCLRDIGKKKRYSIIDGILNLLNLFESLERYEDCIILKNLKDSILLDL